MNIIKLIENRIEFYKIELSDLNKERDGLLTVSGSLKEAVLDLQISLIDLKLSILESLLSTSKQDIIFCIVFVLFLIMGIIAGVNYGFAD